MNQLIILFQPVNKFTIFHFLKFLYELKLRPVNFFEFTFVLTTRKLDCMQNLIDLLKTKLVCIFAEGKFNLSIF